MSVFLFPLLFFIRHTLGKVSGVCVSYTSEDLDFVAKSVVFSLKSSLAYFAVRFPVFAFAAVA